MVFRLLGKRMLAAGLGCWLAISPVWAQAVPAPARKWQTAPAPGLSAGAAILMDWQTGEVLYTQNAHARRDPASTTKVLTAILALERANLTDQVKISRRAAYTPGSSMYIKPGQVYSLHDLIHGLLLRSGNDAAAAIAEHVSGSVEGFAKLMTLRAKELGARNSHFTNPHGLTDKHHFSTAFDLAVITRHALQNETFAGIVSLRDTALTYEHLHRDVILHNTNRLLGIMKDADGVKTGTTSAAGPCLIASATRAEQKLLAVVLHAGNRWGDAARLLEWGFENFQLAYFGREGEVLLKAPVKGGRDRAVPLALSKSLVHLSSRQDAKPSQVKVELAAQIAAPIQTGQRLGRAIVTDGERILDTASLVAVHPVPARTFAESLYHLLSPLVEWLVDHGLH
jgi:D-alanyl-D-alanine carboxypeptidase (penicillin-binding protein 5/6)